MTIEIQTNLDDKEILAKIKIPDELKPHITEEQIL